MPIVTSTSSARRLVREVLTFGAVGMAGLIVDVGVFNALRYLGPGVLEDKPLTAKVISVLVATLVTYAGNRTITWRNRPRGKRSRELVLFFALNGAGMAIALGCLAISHYLLGLTSPLADNVSANGVGLVLGTAFRFWSYRTIVFRHPIPPALDAELRSPEDHQLADNPTLGVDTSRTSPA
jgi:putative flippase GtrA